MSHANPRLPTGWLSRKATAFCVVKQKVVGILSRSESTKCEGGLRLQSSLLSHLAPPGDAGVDPVRFPAKPQLLVSQGFDRIESRSCLCRIEPEQNPDSNRDAKCQGQAPGSDLGLHFLEHF